MKRIAVFASGSGTNFQAIIDAIEAGELSAEICLLVSDNPKAGAIARSQKHGIEVFSFDPKTYKAKVDFETEILHVLNEKKIDLIVLAGYMRLIGSTLLGVYQDKMINIHPSLLPSFPGINAVGQALDYGVKVTGVTIHYVDSGMDTGKIIAQEIVTISPEDTVQSLQLKIQQVEHLLYVNTIQDLLLLRK